MRFRGEEREPVTLTYARLPAAAGALAARLRRESAPGDRLGHPLRAHGIDYAVAFLACPVQQSGRGAAVPGRGRKTSSGKLRRGECRARYLAGRLDPVAMI
ncbi:hypothetical protein AB0346_17235 [Nocardia beijingensis]|uniref:hypothetical protein n=1 Tax=Nocardia beijingensis TaxID=95162 RepID=UPI0034507DD4